MTSIWTTQQPSIRVQWGTRSFDATGVIAALRESLKVLALCGPPFAGPWTLLDPSSQDADGSRVDELADSDVELLIERGVARNHDGQPFPQDGYGVTLVSMPSEGVGASLRLHVGASVTRHIVNEVAVSLRALEPGASVDLRDSFGKHQAEVVRRLVELWHADLAQVSVRDANRSQKRFATLIGLTNFFRGDHSSVLSAIDLPTAAKTTVADGGTWLMIDDDSDDLVTTVASIVATADVIEDAGGLIISS